LGHPRLAWVAQNYFNLTGPPLATSARSGAWGCGGV